MEFRYKGLVLEVPDDVYFPAEDSTMLAEAAEAETINYHSRPKTQDLRPDSVPDAGCSRPETGNRIQIAGCSVLEIGCGSGIASLNAAKNGAKEVLGVDINPEAVRCASENAKCNSITNTSFLLGDMFAAVPKTKKFNIILFNPPYLPTAEDERLGGHINDAFDGGSDGRKALDRFLEDFEKYLSPDGTLLLVQSSLNDLDKTKFILASKGFRIEILAQHNFFFEKLFLLRSTRKKTGDRA